MSGQEISNITKDNILDYVLHQIISNGIKSTTMDSIASGLQISKRTLYEQFVNKEEMINETLNANMRKMKDRYYEIFSNADNPVTAILDWSREVRKFISNANVEFIRDYDEFTSGLKKRNNNYENHYEQILSWLKKGVEEGYFRPDINFRISCRMLSIQLESLKRMEDFFPPDITLLDAYDSITTGFMRSICSDKGLKILNEYIRVAPE